MRASSKAPPRTLVAVCQCRQSCPRRRRRRRVTFTHAARMCVKMPSSDSADSCAPCHNIIINMHDSIFIRAHARKRCVDVARRQQRGADKVEVHTTQTRRARPPVKKPTDCVIELVREVATLAGGS